MNINLLIALIALFLLFIYTFFKPLKIETQNSQKEIPQFEVYHYTLYELDRKQLVDITNGEQAQKFKNRYLFKNFVFLENLDETYATLSAKNGIYKNETLLLTTNVHYTRSDGLDFKSQKLFYNRKKGYVQCDTSYEAFYGKNRLYGDSFFYNINKEMIQSKNIKAYYTLENNTKE